MLKTICMLLLLILPGIAAAHDVPLVDPEPVEVPAGASEAVIAGAIKSGMAAHRWQVLQEQPGVIRASVTGGGDVEATVDIGYDNRQIRIRYVSDHNLADLYTPNYIDSRYIYWTRTLAKNIRAALAGGTGIDHRPAAPETAR